MLKKWTFAATLIFAAGRPYTEPLGATEEVFNVYNRKNVWRKEYDVVEGELIETDVTYMGITPSLFTKIKF